MPPAPDPPDRFTAAADPTPQPAPGWTLERLAGPAPLYGANGIQLAPDGRLYIAQALGPRLSVLDLDSGRLTHRLDPDGPVAAPDDIDFDSTGRAFITDVATGTTWSLTDDGAPIAHATDQPSNNGVTVAPNDRLFIDEFRPGGRLLEGSREPGAPSRVILEDLHGPNALDAAPDGRLYFPLVFAGEIWSVDPDAENPAADARRVVGGLGSPTAVKVDREGSLVATLSGEGSVVRIDPASGAIRHLASLPAGIDNLALHPDGRVFVSRYVDGCISELSADGRVERILLPPGLVGPMDVALRPGGGPVLADGLSLAFLEGGNIVRRARLFTADAAGATAAVHVTPDGRIFTCAAHQLTRYSAARVRPLRSDLHDAVAIAGAPDGWLWIVEREPGRVVRVDPSSDRKLEVMTGLGRPAAIAITPDGDAYVSEPGAPDAGVGRIALWSGGTLVPFAADLKCPQGLAVVGERLFVLDAGARELLAYSRAQGAREVIARHLPVRIPRADARLGGAVGIAAAPDGAILVCANGDGSLLRIAPR